MHTFDRKYPLLTFHIRGAVPGSQTRASFGFSETLSMPSRRTGGNRKPGSRRGGAPAVTSPGGDPPHPPVRRRGDAPPPPRGRARGGLIAKPATLSGLPARARAAPGPYPGENRKPGKPAWCRPDSQWGTLPFEGGSPCLPHLRSRGDPPPVPQLTENVRATADQKAPKAQPRGRRETRGQETAQTASAGASEADAADSYSAKHLSVLEGLDAVRKRPGMYIGSTDGRGLQHCLWEIFDNSVDEAIGGFCTRIEVILCADGSAEVRDNGRGIPVDTERKTRLSGVELVMTRLHAGGKFGGGSYTASGGLHGVGASVVNALSARLDIEVDRQGQTWTTSFRRGVAGEISGEGPAADFTRKSGLRQVAKVPKTMTGTRIRFWPDRQVFLKDAAFSYDSLAERARQTAYLVPGLAIAVRDETRDEAGDQAAEGL